MRSTDSLVKIGKWSDGEQWVTDRDGASEESTNDNDKDDNGNNNRKDDDDANNGDNKHN